MTTLTATFTVNTPPISPDAEQIPMMLHMRSHTPEPEPIPVPAPAHNPYQQAIDNLEVIIDEDQGRHEANQTTPDFLSIRVYRWATAVFRAVREVNLENAEEIERVVLARMQELDEILVNPLDGTPLGENTVLEREWEWSAWAHADCRKLFQLADGSSHSPLDVGIMLNEPPPHLFVRAMLVWRKRFGQAPQPVSAAPVVASGAVVFPMASATPGTIALMPTVGQFQRSMVVLSRNRTFDEIRRAKYRQACQSAIEQRRLQAYQQGVEDGLIEVDHRMNQMRMLSEQVINDAQEEARRAEEELRNRLTRIDETHRNTVTGLQEQIAALEHHQQERVRRLETQIAAMDETQRGTANLLRQEVSAAQEANAATLQTLNHQINILNQTHTEDAARLQRQLDQARQEHIAAVNATTQARQEMAGLGGRLNMAQANLQTTSQALHTAQAQNVQNTAQIRNLNHQINAANQRIQEIQNSGRRGGCVLQ